MHIPRSKVVANRLFGLLRRLFPVQLFVILETCPLSRISLNISIKLTSRGGVIGIKKTYEIKQLNRESLSGRPSCFLDTTDEFIDTPMDFMLSSSSRNTLVYGRRMMVGGPAMELIPR